MTSWAALDEELTRWRDSGKAANFWWRDDDAVRATDALDRLVSLSHQYHAPLALAVIPGHADPSLAESLSGHAHVTILQHGFRHVSHATDADKKSELGRRRPVEHVIGELSDGRALIKKFFGYATLPVLVPPWNRIDDTVVTHLSRLGFCGISRFRARSKREAAPGLAETNTHVDIIDWRGTRGFRGDEAVLADLCDHLAARRTGAVDATEPTGLLTHHLDHDDECWGFIESLLERTMPNANNVWETSDEIFSPHAGLQ
ncbi:MAG: hypothetical protein HOK82_14285 [Rhodospirillaceae bacterium]|nr:hypothetical protein [Rhodospirillaceae bacterium]